MFLQKHIFHPPQKTTDVFGGWWIDCHVRMFRKNSFLLQEKTQWNDISTPKPTLLSRRTLVGIHHHTADLALGAAMFIGGVTCAPFVGGFAVVYTITNIGVSAYTGHSITENLFD